MTRKKVNTILLLIMFVLLFGVSIGYSALSQVLNISGSTTYSHHVNASNLSYDNSSSGLSATTAQAAIDELASSSSSESYTYKYVVSTTQVSVGSTIPSSANPKNTASEAMAQWNSWVGYNNHIYLKHKLNSSNVVVESYVELYNNDNFTGYFKATTGSFLGTASAYQSNITALSSFSKSSSYCTTTSTSYSCGDSYGIGVVINSNGNVNAYDYCSGSCYIDSNGRSSCQYDTSGC